MVYSPPVSWTNRFRFTGSLPATARWAFAIWVSMSRSDRRAESALFVGDQSVFVGECPRLVGLLYVSMRLEQDSLGQCGSVELPIGTFETGVPVVGDNLVDATFVDELREGAVSGGRTPICVETREGLLKCSAHGCVGSDQVPSEPNRVRIVAE